MCYSLTEGNLQQKQIKRTDSPPLLVLYRIRSYRQTMNQYTKQAPVFFSSEQHFLTSLDLCFFTLRCVESHMRSFCFPLFQQNKNNLTSSCTALFLSSYVTFPSYWEEDVDVLIIQTEFTSSDHSAVFTEKRREGRFPGNKHMVFLHYMISGELLQNPDFTLDTIAKLYKSEQKSTLSNIY